MNSWNGKPYHSLDFHLKEMFGRKVYKLALDGGMTCPNRDGSVGRGGCIFCSQGGSGDFAAKKQLSLREQADLAKKLVEWTPLPVIIKANAGLPNLNSGGYDISAEQFAEQMDKFMDLGVRIIGGCCGS